MTKNNSKLDIFQIESKRQQAADTIVKIDYMMKYYGFAPMIEARDKAIKEIKQLEEYEMEQ